MANSSEVKHKHHQWQQRKVSKQLVGALAKTRPSLARTIYDNGELYQ